MTAADRPYSPLSSLLPRSWLPLVEIADGMAAFGAATFGQDALGLHQYALAAMYEVTQHELLGNAAYLYDGRHGLLLDRTHDGQGTTLDDDEIEAYEISGGRAVGLDLAPPRAQPPLLLGPGRRARAREAASRRGRAP